MEIVNKELFQVIEYEEVGGTPVEIRVEWVPWIQSRSMGSRGREWE